MYYVIYYCWLGTQMHIFPKIKVKGWRNYESSQNCCLHSNTEFGFLFNYYKCSNSLFKKNFWCDFLLDQCKVYDMYSMYKYDISSTSNLEHPPFHGNYSLFYAYRIKCLIVNIRYLTYIYFIEIYHFFVMVGQFVKFWKFQNRLRIEDFINLLKN